MLLNGSSHALHSPMHDRGFSASPSEGVRVERRSWNQGKKPTKATPTGFENDPPRSRAINTPPLRGSKSVRLLICPKSGGGSEPRRGDLFIARDLGGSFQTP